MSVTGNLLAEDGAAAQPATPSMLLGSSYGIDTVYGSNQQAGWEAWDTELRSGGAGYGMAAHRTYDSNNPPADFMNSQAAPDVAMGVASVWSCKPQASDVLAGNLDATFTSFFNTVPNGHRAYLMMWHEPWDKLGNQFATWAEFRSAQEYVWDLLQASNADTNLVTWGILGTGYDFQQNRAQSNYFPASGKYDWVGVDTYDFWRNSPNSSDGHSPYTAPNDPRGRDDYRTPAQMFDPCMNYAASVSKPVVVGEFSFHPDPAYPNSTNPAGVPSRPDRLQATVDYFVANNTVCACMFESHNGDSGPWWLRAVPNWSTAGDRSTVDAPTVAKIQELLGVYGIL